MSENPREKSKRKVVRTRRSATPEQIILSVSQTAILLGWTERATWQAIYRHRIPFRRLGKKVFIIRSELLAYIERLEGNPDEAIPP